MPDAAMVLTGRQERLCEELVAELFEAGLVGHFTAHDEYAKSQVCAPRVHTLVQIADTLMQESIRLQYPLTLVSFPSSL